MSSVIAHHGILRDTRLHVDDTGGSGRPVVLIHGWPLSGESWSSQVPTLSAAGYRVITYDRRGFGRSDRTLSGYDYDTLTDDLHAVITGLDLFDVTLVGFSMGGGEVARYFTRYGNERLRSVVFAAAVPPYLAKSADNPDGPLDQDQADEMERGLKADDSAFYDGFLTQFFSVDGELIATQQQMADARSEAAHADHRAAVQCMSSFGTTDFRADVRKVSVPALIIHGAGDGVVPFDGSGRRTHEMIDGSRLHVVDRAPHGLNVTHADEFNATLIDFLALPGRSADD